MKKLTVFLLAICLIFSALPAVALAEEHEYLSDIYEVADALREAMTDRESAVTVYYQTEDTPSQQTISDILDAALDHTGGSDEGDYLHWHVESANCGGSFYSDGYVNYCTFNYTFTYYTNAEQEQAVGEKIDEVVASFGFTAATTDYEKIEAVYSYICANTDYDYAGLKDSSNTIKYSAYGALINGLSVCQGYANLFYRFMLELNIDCRIITGRSRNENHAWNIVKLDGAYYYADATWDEGATFFRYFLKCEEHFTEHVRNGEYLEESFVSLYQISEECYDGGKYCKDNAHELGDWYAIKEPTCTERGDARRDCANCPYFETAIYETRPHKTESHAGKDATCAENGWTAYEECVDCDYTTFKEIPATDEHTAGEWVTVTEAEVGKEGKKEQRCSVCNELLAEDSIPALEAPSFICGDVTKDGAIDKFDYILVKRAVLGTYMLDGIQTSAADVNHDGTVDKFDYILVKRHVMGTYVIG